MKLHTKLTTAILLAAAMSLQASAQTVESMIQGSESGVRVSLYDGNPTGAVSTLIRGINSMRSGSQPLWIVDGVILNSALSQNTDAFYQYDEDITTPTLSQLAFLNPDDIESVEILKNQSATAIYGSRGANGVIIIRTRKQASEGLSASWDSKATLAMPAQKGDAFRTGVGQSHSVCITSNGERNIYTIAASYRDLPGDVRGNSGSYGGLRAAYETKANSVVRFGMNTQLSLGKVSSATGWLEDHDDDSKDKRLLSSVYLLFNLSPSLTLRTSLGLDYQNNDRYIWYGNGTGFGRKYNGAASIMGSSMFRYVADAEIDWHRHFGDHLFSATAAAETGGDLNKFNTMNGTDFFTHSLRARGLNIHASKSDIHKFDYSFQKHAARISAAYDYRSIVMADVLVRADWTPRYDDSTPALYYGANLSIDLHKALMADCRTLSSLGISTGYGKAGHEEFVPYGLFSSYITGEYPIVDKNLDFFYEALNRVTSKEWNIAIDLGLFEDRIKAGAALYIKNTDDAFSAYCFGQKGSSYLWNWGPRTELFSQSSGIRNAGIEFNASGDIFKGKPFGWTLYTNGAYAVNQVSYVHPSDVMGKSVAGTQIVNANAIGYTVNSLYGFQTYSDGQPADQTGDGLITDADKIIIGNPLPKFHGATGSRMTLAGFTLDIMADYAFGFDILNLERLMKESTAPHLITDRYVEKGDFFRLAKVSLSYDIPIAKGKLVKGLKVSAEARNLFSGSAYSGWNPDVNCYGAAGFSSGIDYHAFPMMRSILGGINIVF